MKTHFVQKHILTLLLLIFITPCYGQAGGYMFRCSLRDKAGNLWFGTCGAGVYRYDAISGVFTNFTKQDGLIDNNIESVYEDKEGNLWFGTENGVCRYGKSLPTGQPGFTDITSQIGLSKFLVNYILEDRSGNIWIASNGWGVFRYSPSARQARVTNFTKEQGLGSNAVQCILEDNAGNIWFGERAGGVCRYDSASGRFIKVDGDGCFSSQIMDIKQDRTGNIWFANLYTGLCRYDGKSQHPGQAVFTHFPEENGLFNDTITCIYEDKKGNLWFGIDGSKWGAIRGGVCRYDPSSGMGSFTHFSIKEGPDNVGTWTIVEDKDGNIWVGSRRGLFRYHSPSGRFINYTYKLK